MRAREGRQALYDQQAAALAAMTDKHVAERARAH